MLDIEQNDQQDTQGQSTPETSGSDTPPRPRRRRAATRPAGPPIVPDGAEQSAEAAAPESPAAAPGSPAGTTEPPAAEPGQPAEAAAPAKKTAKRAPRKTAAATAGTAEGATTRAPRKRATKKAAAAPAAETPAAETAAAETPAGETPAAETPAAEFQPPIVVATEGGSNDRLVLAPSEAALLAAIEEAVASGEAATVVQPAAELPTVEQSWLPAEEGAPSADETPAVETPAVEAPADETIEEEPPVEDSTSTADESGEQAAQVAEARDTDQPGDTDTDQPDDSDDSDDTDESEESDDTEDTEDTEDSDEEPTRRRRRRRGGRRRRRGGGGDGANDESGEAGDAESDSGTKESADASSDSGEPAAATTDDGPDGASTDDAREAGDTDDNSSGEGDGDGEGQRRRRRRRRRRGEDSAASPDDPADVVVRVREPSSRRKASEQPAGIEGSTRLEAKRQRRREGREAGRRRAPILNEAEFLARRESVKRAMVIRQRDDLTQIAVLEDDILVEHYVDRDSAASLIGNVYLGRVQNVLPSMEAAFIDIGRGRNAVLYAGEVDWDSFGAEGQARKVEKVLKSGQTVLVQVTKDPVGAKGARLTNHVSIPGRYIVYAPGGHLSGISRKLPDTERKRLKDILADLVPDSASVIVRTAAEGASEDELVRDVNRLKAQWEDIERKVKAGQAPQPLYGEPDLTLRIVRDLFTEDFSELLVAGNEGPEDAYDAIEAYVGHVAPHLAERLKRWTPENGEDIFAAHRIDEQIAKALERKVFLPSGGSLVIDRTEAMTVIDVNTGKFTGTGGNLEATVTSNNLEAAEEIVRQLRLRDIGGIIVIDFIDMVLPSNRELLLRRLVECLGRDRTRHQVAEVTSLGLVQMTRKKIGTGLMEAFSTECEHCHGRGYEIHDLPVESQKQADGGARERDRGGRQRTGRRGGGGGGGGGRGGSGGGSNGSQGGSSGDSGASDSEGSRSGEAPAPVG